MKVGRFILLTVIVLLFSCEKQQTGTEYIVDRCWEYSIAHPKGFTLNIQTFQEPAQGIVVAYKATQNSFGKEGLSVVVHHALEHNYLVGGWMNQSDGNYYFDSDTLFNETDLEAALEWGRKNNQKAVFILSKHEQVPCN